MVLQSTDSKAPSNAVGYAACAAASATHSFVDAAIVSFSAFVAAAGDGELDKHLKSLAVYWHEVVQ